MWCNLPSFHSEWMCFKEHNSRKLVWSHEGNSTKRPMATAMSFHLFLLHLTATSLLWQIYEDLQKEWLLWLLNDFLVSDDSQLIVSERKPRARVWHPTWGAWEEMKIRKLMCVLVPNFEPSLNLQANSISLYLPRSEWVSTLPFMALGCFSGWRKI